MPSAPVQWQVDNQAVFFFIFLIFFLDMRGPLAISATRYIFIFNTHFFQLLLSATTFTPLAFRTRNISRVSRPAISQRSGVPHICC